MAHIISTRHMKEKILLIAGLCRHIAKSKLPPTFWDNDPSALTVCILCLIHTWFNCMVWIWAEFHHPPLPPQIPFHIVLQGKNCGVFASSTQVPVGILVANDSGADMPVKLHYWSICPIGQKIHHAQNLSAVDVMQAIRRITKWSCSSMPIHLEQAFWNYI